MKRILALILCAVILIGVFSIPISASDEAVTTSETSEDALIAEMESNLKDFNPDSFPTEYAEGTPMVIGASLTSFVDETDRPAFHVYVYNPRRYSGIVSGTLYFSFNATGSGVDSYSRDLSALGCSMWSNTKSEDNRFIRYSIYLDTIMGVTDYKPYTEFSFDITRMKGYCGGGYTNKYDLSFKMNYKFIKQEDGSYQVESSKENLVRLDVETTSYRIGTVGTDLDRKYEIFTAYFSLPQEYIDTYESLYSVSSSYIKRKSTPIIWGNYNPYDVYGPVTLNQFYRSKDYTANTSSTGYTDIYIDWVANSAFESIVLNRYYFSEKYDGYLGWYFYKEDGADGVVTDEEILTYLSDNPLFINATQEELEDMLFVSSQDFANSTKTVNDKFDALNYFQNADFSDYWSDFGLGSAILSWLYKDSPDKIQELIGQNLIDVNYDEFLTNQPNLVLLAESDREQALLMNDETLAKTYLIGDSDVTAFRNYLNNNKNVVLYRFDVEEYRSMEIVRPKSNNSLLTDGYSYGMCEKYMYFDFEVIDVTFSDKGEYVSIGVGSAKQDVVGDDLEVEEEDGPGFTPNPDAPFDIIDLIIPDIPGIIDTGKKFLENVVKAVKVVVAIVGVVLLFSIVLFVSKIGSKKKNTNKSSDDFYKNE